MSDFETVKYGVHNGLATIELTRPEKLNAFNAQMFNELADAVTRAAEDPGIRVVLVKGQGRAFSSGIDVLLLGQLSGTRGARFRAFAKTAQRPFEALALMEKPTIAAVQGHALGAGFQLALACDLRIVADDVEFAALEVRFGIIPDLGGPHRLARFLGAPLAKELIWTGRTMGAEEAQRVGLANRVVPADALDQEAETYARTLVASPPIPVSLTKSLINRAPETPLEASLEQQSQAQAACVETEDHREAVEAYLEKRTPRFTGR
jgi:2-(1,2-epoxy-1,2-dihydrophenyl)acetyl-CoA isomerase